VNQLHSFQAEVLSVAAKNQQLIGLASEKLRNTQRMAAEEPTTNLGNCPHCTNIIFKDAVFNSEATFSMRCPHCNKTLKVIVKTRVEIVILPVSNEHKQKRSGPGLVAVLLVLYLPPVLHQLKVDTLLELFS
jgi:DNA-directed RNA polymerase subunit RPC12/RpoP